MSDRPFPADFAELCDAVIRTVGVIGLRDATHRAGYGGIIDRALGEVLTREGASRARARTCRCVCETDRLEPNPS